MNPIKTIIAWKTTTAIVPPNNINLGFDFSFLGFMTNLKSASAQKLDSFLTANFPFFL